MPAETAINDDPVRRRQTTGEEIANSVSHAVGAALGLAGLAYLVTRAALAGGALRVVSFAVYGAALCALYLCSTLYHSLPRRAKRVFQVFDHTSIYLLIAGTYTPFSLIGLGGAWGWSLFGVIWGLCLLGILFKCFFTGRYGYVSTLIYIAMGWTALVAVKPLFERLGPACLAWVLAGGLAYTFGVLFYAWKGLRFGHFIWHLFVLLGSLLHFLAITLFLLP